MSIEPNRKLRVAFLVQVFPIVSETFIIDQVAELLDRGIDVQIFSFYRGSREFVSSRYEEYRLQERTQYLQPPASRILRLLSAIPTAFAILLKQPLSLIRALNVMRYGKQALSLQLLFWIAPFVGQSFDLVHCHFGPVANSFLTIKDFVGLKAPLVTTFYGFDVSAVFTNSASDIYDRLKRECSLFFVMSKDMSRRVIEQGFPAEKVVVNPVSIDVDSYRFSERGSKNGAPVEIISVGRFVEKKGFDDLLRALAIVKKRSDKSFRCSIVGGGALEGDLRKLARSLNLEDNVSFLGYLKIEEIIQLLPKMHLMVQPSKTASDGDME